MKRTVLSSLFCCLALSALAQEQPEEGPKPARLEVEPQKLTLEIGRKARLTATVKDAAGARMDLPVVYFSRARRSVGVNAAGEVEAYRPGEFTVVALVPKDPEDLPRRAEAIIQAEIQVTVPNPPIESIAFAAAPSRFYAGTTVPLQVKVVDTAGFDRPTAPVRYSVDDTSLATINRFGHLDLIGPGTVTVTARAEAATDRLRVGIESNPVARISLRASADEGRSGDVIHFEAFGVDREGTRVAELPIHLSVAGRTAPGIVAPGASAQIEQDGRFVAERSGYYTVTAAGGGRMATHTVNITPRNVRRKIELVGHGAVRDRRTSDLWVWEGTDGRDYAITGTWGADGHAYIWDVTDPRHMSIVDMVRVDARTVNDVKVSEDGRIAVISREGASNRKNGLVILDVSDIANGVRILARYDDQLSGGVHNVFIDEGHIFALSAGRRYDIINIYDPAKPTRAGRFELSTPGHGIHDVWVSGGVAYSSNWLDGVVAVDVGGGGQGGSRREPVKLGSYEYPSGWNHAAFPYTSKSTGKRYVFAGDEAFPYRRVRQTRRGGTPLMAAGWIHVIEWDDWKAPREVARYQVPEAGSHNLWVEDDILYVGYYNGGLRVVDVSGELMGDLYRQGREIAFFVPNDPEGYSPNAPFTWGPQPFKGNIFFADWNSGLWCVKLGDKEEIMARGRHRFGEPH